MKKVFLFLILFLAFCVSSFAQDEISLPRDVAEKALKALELNPALETKVAALERQVKELESAKLTPCAVAQEKVKLDTVFWLEKYQSADDKTKKQIEKVLKQTLKLGSKSIQAQCGFEEKSRFMEWLKVGANFAPLLILLK